MRKSRFTEEQILRMLQEAERGSVGEACRRHNDTLMSVFVDLGAKDMAPDPTRPHFLWVKLPLRIARADGLSSSEESPSLNAIEDALVPVLERDLQARFVGSITGAHRREFYFYAPTAVQLSSVVETVFAAFPDYRPQPGHELDASWTQYFTRLILNPREIQLSQNHRLILQLRQAGDPLIVPRPVTHTVVFGNVEERAVAAQRFKSADFQVEETEPAPQAAFPFGIQLVRDECIDPTSMDTTVRQIFDLLEGWHAQYDGWESPVVTPVSSPVR